MSEWQETEFGLIPDTWSIKTVGELVEENVLEKPLDGNHGEIHPKGTDFVSSGIPFVMATDVINGKIDLVNCKFISIEQANSLSKGFSITGDVLLTHKASLGRTAIVGELKTPFIMLTPQVTYYRVKDYEKLNNKFLKHFFNSPVFQDTLINHGDSGSTRAYVGITAQRDLPVILPKIEEQKAIASVLSSLDDKIDLLHRQNTTLQRMAETLFRQWFVEEAQDDWEAGKLSDVSDNIRQSVQAKDIQATTKYIGLEHIDRRNIALKEYGVGEDVSSNKYAFEKNDILFGKLRPYFHKVCFSPFFGICSTDILVIRPKSPDYFAFCLFAYFQNDVVEYANLGSGGTRMPRTDWETLKQYPISLPDKETLLKFNAIVVPSLNKITENLVQIQTLEKLRDNLLPKLMSGEVRVELQGASA